MTQHPFDREFSEQEAAKLNAEQELTDEDMEQVAGGSTVITRKKYEAGSPISRCGTPLRIGEEGGHW